MSGLQLNPKWAKLPLFARKGWTHLPFGEIAENIRESVIPTPADSAYYIGLEHMDTGALHVRRWGSEADLKGQKLRMRKGDILFAKRNAYLRRVAIAPHDGLFSAHGMILRAKKNVVLPEFLPFLMMSDEFMARAEKISVGSLSPTINWTTLKREEFDLPPLAQQHRIAEILWALEKVVCNSEDSLSSMESSMNAFVSSLTDEKATVKWRSRPLVDCVDIVSGQVDPKNSPYNSMFLIAPNHIEQGSGQLLGRETAAQQNAISGKYLFEAGDVVYSKIRPNLRKCFIANFPGLCSADMYALRPKPTMIQARYLLAILLGEYFTSFAISRCVRTGIPKINRIELAEYVIPIPDISEQGIVCDQLSRFDIALITTRKYIQDLRQVNTSLLRIVFGDTS